MISVDTNLLLYSLNRDCAEYPEVRAFFASLPTAPGAVAICELVLLELYVLLHSLVAAIHDAHRAIGPCRRRMADGARILTPEFSSHEEEIVILSPRGKASR